MKVLVCGGRDYVDTTVLEALLQQCHQQTPFTMLIHGDARGADRLAGAWAQHRSIPVTTYPAQWAQYGRAAGPIRNQVMLDQEHPDCVIAFPGGRGTDDMVRRARTAGLSIVFLEGRA